MSSNLVKIAIHKIFKILFPNEFNDRLLIQQRRLFHGQQAEQRKIAIYLIFPKNGALESHLLALKSMIENGYAPFIVSNLPLGELDLQKLRPLAWQIMERYNFGYDFGGYREAVLWLASRLSKLDQLVLMNDSTWFPLPGAMNWLAEAEALRVDMAGALGTGHAGRCKAHQYMTTAWRFEPPHRNFHYGSFALSVAAPMLCNPEFLRFWKKLRLSQVKFQTIKRGEFGFTQWVRASGHSHGSTTDMARLDLFLAEMTEKHLRKIFEQLVIAQDDKAQAVLDKLVVHPGLDQLSRQQMESFIHMAVMRRGTSLALPRFLIEEHKFAFLKRFAATPGHPHAASMANLINDLQEPMRSLALEESGLKTPNL